MTCLQMKDDLKDQFNEFVPEGCEDIKVPRPYDPSLSDQYIGIANYGKVSTGRLLRLLFRAEHSRTWFYQWIAWSLLIVSGMSSSC